MHTVKRQVFEIPDTGESDMDTTAGACTSTNEYSDQSIDRFKPDQDDYPASRKNDLPCRRRQQEGRKTACQPYPKARRTPSTSISDSDVIFMDTLSRLESDCEADDEDEIDVDQTLPWISERTRFNQYASDDVPLSHPSSSIWRGREEARLAVVVFDFGSAAAKERVRPCLDELSASRINSRRRNTERRATIPVVVLRSRLAEDFESKCI